MWIALETAAPVLVHMCRAAEMQRMAREILAHGPLYQTAAKKDLHHNLRPFRHTIAATWALRVALHARAVAPCVCRSKNLARVCAATRHLLCVSGSATFSRIQLVQLTPPARRRRAAPCRQKQLHLLRHCVISARVLCSSRARLAGSRKRLAVSQLQLSQCERATCALSDLHNPIDTHQPDATSIDAVLLRPFSHAGGISRVLAYH